VISKEKRPEHISARKDLTSFVRVTAFIQLLKCVEDIFRNVLLSLWWAGPDLASNGYEPLSLACVFGPFFLSLSQSLEPLGSRSELGSEPKGGVARICSLRSGEISRASLFDAKMLFAVTRGLRRIQWDPLSKKV
jgi:hypothetical protein